MSPEQFEDIILIDREVWKQEMPGHSALFEKACDRIPEEFLYMRELLLSGLWSSPERRKLDAEPH